MAPISYRKHLGRDKFGAQFSLLKTQQYTDPATRTLTPTIHRTISWNASGGLIATGANDKTVRVWNPERTSPRSQTELRGHGHAVEKVLFNPAREFELASCSSDGTVRFWDTRSKTCVTKLDVGGEPFTLNWSTDGSTLLAGTKGDVLIPISTAIPSSPVVLSRHKQPQQTNQTTFSNAHPPTDLLITQGDGSVKILDYPSFQPLHTISAHTSSCTAIAYCPNGKYVAVGGSDAMISLWDTTDWVCRRTVSNPSSGAIRGLSWSWDGRYLVGASEEMGSGSGGESSSAGLEIYHAETGDVVHTILTGTSGIPAVEWHPNRYWLAYTQIEETRQGKSSLKIVGAAGGPSI
ncbi:THO complex subunit 3 [Exophiala dermatitidis]